MTFDEWYPKQRHDLKYSIARQAWDYQQARISKLEAAIRRHKEHQPTTTLNNEQLYAVLQEQGNESL